MTQANFRFVSDAPGGDQFTVIAFTGHEKISSLYRYQIEVKAPVIAEINLDDDEAGCMPGGVMSGIIIGPSRHVKGSVKVFSGGMPVTRMLDTTMQNLSNTNGGMTIVPSQTKVIISSYTAVPLTLRGVDWDPSPGTVCRMDAAFERTWTYLQRVPGGGSQSMSRRV